MKEEKYVKLDDILKILPKNDKVCPKPSYLRKYLETIPYVTVLVISSEDYPMTKESETIELSF